MRAAKEQLAEATQQLTGLAQEHEELKVKFEATEVEKNRVVWLHLLQVC